MTIPALRVPDWFASGVLDRYQSRASHLFLLHGNIRDVYGFGSEFVTLGNGLRRLSDARPFAVSYDPSSGLHFPDAAREKAVRKALGLKAALPGDAARALILLDALVRSERCPPGSVAVILEFAHTLAPSDASGGDRTNVTTLSRWASDPAVAQRRPLILLSAPTAGEVASEIYSGASGAEVVEVPRPTLEIRADYAKTLQERNPGLVWELTPDGLAAETGGLMLVQIEDIVQRAGAVKAPLRRDAIVTRKIDLLQQEYGDMLEIIQPKHDLSAVGGLEHATSELKEVADIMRRGLTSAAPMGLVLMGPPGTGKSYLAECFAKECGMLCVRFKPLRQMYVGQSERNQVKAFAAIRALAPVIVVVDESDQAEGGSRDAGGGDSGVAERMRAAAFNFWGDGTLRGRVLRIDITNRIDLIDSAMRRSGRSDVKIPILMPDAKARAQIFAVTLKKHKLSSTISDFEPYGARTSGFTGSDIELALTTAYRFAARENRSTIDAADLTAALDDLLPTVRDQAAIDRMTLLALDECRNKRLLPRNHEAIRKEIEARTPRG